VAGKHTFQFDGGADLAATLTWRDSTGAAVDMTGYTAAMTLSVPGAAPVVLTGTSGLALGGALGTITFDMTSAVTAGWPASFPYELFVTSPAGFVTKLLYGDFARAS
jgi:hypothetical protein